MNLSQNEIHENAAAAVALEQMPSTSGSNNANSVSSVLVSEYYIENHVKETVLTPTRKYTSSVVNSTSNKLELPDMTEAAAHVVESPIKKTQQYRIQQQQNLSDVNSIESISDNTKVPSLDLDWMDPLLELDEINMQKRQQNASNAATLKMPNNNSKTMISTITPDQLDSVPMRVDAKPQSIYVEEDDKCVKCLHYTLMCCECSIS